MDFGDPWVLISGFLIGGIGFVILMYGKKEWNLKCITAGLVLCAFPYFVTSLILMWLIAAGCVGGLYLATKYT